MTLCPVFVLIFFVLYSIITQVFLLRKMADLFLNIDKKPTTKDFIPFRPLHSGLNSKSTGKFLQVYKSNTVIEVQFVIFIGVVNNLKLILFLTAASALQRSEQPHNHVVMLSWASHLPLFQILHESLIHHGVLEQPSVNPQHFLGGLWAVSYWEVSYQIVSFSFHFISFFLFGLICLWWCSHRGFFQETQPNHFRFSKYIQELNKYF